MGVPKHANQNRHVVALSSFDYVWGVARTRAVRRCLKRALREKNGEPHRAHSTAIRAGAAPVLR